jgi:Bacterial lipid A biosynthesis acyltransferase
MSGESLSTTAAGATDPALFDRGGWIRTARGLLESGMDLPAPAFHGEVAFWIADCIAHMHPDATEFRDMTAEALTWAGHDRIDATRLADSVFRHYLRSHYVDKVLVSSRLPAALRWGRDLLECAGLAGLAGQKRGAVLCSLHFSSYPLLPLAFALMSVPVVFLRARPDVMEQGNEADGRVIYASDRMAPVKLVRAIDEGKCILIMADQLDAKAESAEVSLFGRRLKVNVGLAWLAFKAQVPIIPLVLHQVGGAIRFDCLPVIPADSDKSAVMQKVFMAFEPVLRAAPENWVTRYTLADEERALRLRNRLKSSNDLLWKKMVAR